MIGNPSKEELGRFRFQMPYIRVFFYGPAFWCVVFLADCNVVLSPSFIGLHCVYQPRSGVWLALDMDNLWEILELKK